MQTEYVLAVSTKCYRVDDETFAIESAFAEHVRMLKRKLQPHFDRIYLLAPQGPEAQYSRDRDHLGHIREKEEGIYYVAMEGTDHGIWEYWTRDALRIWRSAHEVTARARVVHGGLAYDPRRPSMFMVELAAARNGCKTLFFLDIDYRKNAYRFWKTGVWSLRSYVICKLLWDPMRSLQVRWAARNCSLVLLKSAEMVKDFGQGRANVRNFWDTAHSGEHVIDSAALQSKIARITAAQEPLSLVYFGRLVQYKGIDRTLQALAKARASSGRHFVLDVIGSGEEKTSLEALARSLSLVDAVRFHPPIPYGQALFERIRRADLLLATPLAEDTPRSAFDAMAGGVPILAFDIAYYRYLATDSGAVETVPWSDTDALAAGIVALDRDRNRLREMTEAAVRFARENTQDIWLDRRIQWTFDLLDGPPA